jgi:uncharacterized Zn-binding protein involved in type VI secretion
MGSPACTIGSMTAHGGNVVMGLPTVLIGGKPASRIGDMHACPMVTVLVPHVGGPFILGSFTVLVGGMPQSRVGDALVCVGPPDSAVMGVPTVLVGMAGAAGLAGLMKGLAMAAGAVLGRLFNSESAYPYTALNADGSYTTQYNPNITIHGALDFTSSAIQALHQLEGTRTGRALEKGYADSGHHVTIEQTNDDNGYCTPKDGNDARTPGKGTDSTIQWNPNHNTVDAAGGDNPGSTVILGHEMTHAYHNATGTNANGPYLSYAGQNGGSALGEERSTVGSAGTQVLDPSGNPVAVPDYSSNVPTENSLRDDLGIPRRTNYYPSNWPGGAPW